MVDVDVMHAEEPLAEASSGTLDPAVGTLPPSPGDERRREGLRWLGQLRWWALTCAMIGVLLSISLSWTFVSAPAVVGGVLVTVLVNGVLFWRTQRGARIARDELLVHVVVDLFLLTWLLAWSGGVRNPLAVAYCFHVLLGALLNGRRGAISASVAAFLCIALLWIVERQHALPMPPLKNPPALLWAGALGMLIVGLSYLALVVVERNADANARAREKGREAEGNLALLLKSLAALKVGLELVTPEGRTRLANETAERVRALPPAKVAQAQLTEQVQAGAQGVLHQRFAVDVDGAGERIIDLLALAPSSEAAPRALLYVDRTDELLVEQRHVMLERLATLGRAMQGVAHELNTPLTTMQTLAKDLRAALAHAPLDDTLRADVEESLTLLIEESRRCRTLTQSLLATANEGRAQPGLRGQSVLDVARRAVRLVGHAADAEGAGVALDITLDDTQLHDGDRVLQVLMNLIQNALRATQDLRDDGRGPRVRVDAAHDDTSLRVRVIDRGPGLPEVVRARLFEPFVTTRPVGEGTGLGLYTSHRIAHELGGTLEIEDAEGGGTCATVVLPVAAFRRTDTSTP